MSAHGKATPQSRDLCDLLLVLVRESIPETTRNEAQKVCSMGTTRSAFVYHSRGGMRVYLRGKDDDGVVLERLVGGDGVIISRRHAMGSPWAKLTPYYLDIDSEDGVRSSVPLVLYAAHNVMKAGRGGSIYLSPSEENDREMAEGARTTVEVSRIERDTNAREKCIEIFGAKCAVCAFDFEKTYGTIGAGFIHVHHLKPLAAANGRRKVDPKTDLRPVCPNCHEMLHRQRPPFTIEELQRIILRG